MRTLLVFAFFLTVPLASGTFQPTREEDFWRTTDVDLKFAKSFFNDETCHKSPDLNRVCRMAIVHGLKMLHAENAVQIVPDGEIENIDSVMSRIDELASSSEVRIPKAMLYGSMINDALKRFDAHAMLLPTEYSLSKTEGATEETTGMGFDEEITAAGAFVRRIYPGTPAESSGLKINDRILQVNGTPVEPGLKGYSAFRLASARPGQEVEFVVDRNGVRRSIFLSLAPMVLRHVDVRFFPFGQRTYALAEVRIFSHGVCREIYQRIEFARGQLSGVILDLRGNPGGVMTEAACVMGLFAGRAEFVKQKPIQTLLPEQFPLPQKSFAVRSWRDIQVDQRYPDIPLMVLVNGGSASASEMLAAALQDSARAWVVGESTFGKGTTQLMFKLPEKSSVSMIYTVSRFYRPQGTPIQLVGMTPDFLIPFRQRATAAERRVFREADLFPTSLQRESMAVWQNPRMGEVNRIQTCIQQQSLDRKFSIWHERVMGHEDYQKSYGLAVLHCAT